MPEQTPSVGRIIHISHPNGSCRAAIVTQVYDVGAPWLIDLAVFDPPGQVYSAPFCDEPSVDTWHWPERV